MSKINSYMAVQHSPKNMRQRFAKFKKNAAFELWRLRLSPCNRLPRGRYFADKKPGANPIVLDEAWMYFNR